MIAILSQLMSCYPEIIDRETWQAARDELLVREKAHTRAGDAIAAARRRLPLVEADATTPGCASDPMAPAYGLLDMTVYGRQEEWEDSPEGWPRLWRAGSNPFRTDGRPIAQWPRLAAGFSDDLGS